jgi:hypothetical protein
VDRVTGRAAHRSVARAEKGEQEQPESDEERYMNKIAQAIDGQDTDDRRVRS